MYLFCIKLEKYKYGNLLKFVQYAYCLKNGKICKNMQFQFFLFKYFMIMEKNNVSYFYYCIVIINEHSNAIISEPYL